MVIADQKAMQGKAFNMAPAGDQNALHALIKNNL